MKLNDFYENFLIFLLFLGMFYAFLPHSWHAKLPFGPMEEHMTHVFFGVSLAAAAIFLLVVRRRAFSLLR